MSDPRDPWAGGPAAAPEHREPLSGAVQPSAPRTNWENWKPRSEPPRAALTAAAPAPVEPRSPYTSKFPPNEQNPAPLSEPRKSLQRTPLTKEWLRPPRPPWRGNLVDTGRQLSIPGEDKGDILTSTYFKLWSVEAAGSNGAFFSELAGITSEIEHHEYMEAGPLGSFFSRHPGRPRPPTVTLKRGMKVGGINSSTTWIWTWHQLAKMKLPGMLRDCAVLIYGANDDPAGAPRMGYMMMNAFPAKVELAGMKVGGSEVIVQTVTLQCDEMFDPNAAGEF